MRDFSILGLTGPSGSGKSNFCEYLINCGFVCIDADSISRQILKPGSTCLLQLKSAFGDDISDKNGFADRKLLAQIAFSSSKNTELLNNITHPWILFESLKIIKGHLDNGEKLIVFDAPLLFESNMDIFCDMTASVIADRQLRLERIIKRDNISTELAEKRFNAQHDDKYYISKSDFVIDGAGNNQYLKKTAADIKNALLLQKGGV